MSPSQVSRILWDYSDISNMVLAKTTSQRVGQWTRTDDPQAGSQFCGLMVFRSETHVRTKTASSTNGA